MKGSIFAMLEKLLASQLDATESDIVLIVSRANRNFEENLSASSKATKSASRVFWFNRSSIYGKRRSLVR